MNILLVKPGAIGDLLQLSPVVRALKARNPQVRITLLVGNAASADLFRHNPLVDEILVYDKRNTHRSMRAFGKLWMEMRQRHFDLIVNYQRRNLKLWLLIAAAMPSRLLVYHRAQKRPMHAVENHLEAVAPLGIDPQKTDLSLELFPGVEDEQWADELLLREGMEKMPLIALNLGASHAVNRWPIGHFSRLGQLLMTAGIGVVLVGGGDTDRELANALLAKTTTRPLDMVGRTTLLQLGALLKRCSIVVSGDTGPMHMATAVGTRVIALFGAADPARTGPVGTGHRVIQASGVECIPCRSRRCTSDQQLQCMEKITAEQVFAVVAAMGAEGGESCAS